MKNLLFVLSLFISTSVHSVEYAVDSIAEVAEGEVAKFYPNSVRDKYGEKYKIGKGFMVFIDDKLVKKSLNLRDFSIDSI